VEENQMKILCFAGSLRSGSYNKKYVGVAASILKDMKGVEVKTVDLANYALPVFSQDIQDKGFPQGVVDLANEVKACDALVISTPEYNGSISSVLKTTIDWLSRDPLNPWPGKHVCLLGASPGALGAVRGLWHSRQPFEVLGCHVFPEMSGLPRAHEAFDENGNLKDKAGQERLAKLLSKFVEYYLR
jgi:chromate reductase, NAD(P)H dehydrogenase (quinone)